jgi:hypothetical protein
MLKDSLLVCELEDKRVIEAELQHEDAQEGFKEVLMRCIGLQRILGKMTWCTTL